MVGEEARGRNLLYGYDENRNRDESGVKEIPVVNDNIARMRSYDAYSNFCSTDLRCATFDRTRWSLRNRRSR